MPVPGDFAVVATPGIMARLIRLVTRSTVNHAFMLVAPGRIIEAKPSGAQVVLLANYDGMPQTWSDMDLSPTVRAAIVDHALDHLGDPYSWVDDACIGLADLFGWHVPAAVRRRLARPDRLMCSQLVDVAYLEAGVHLWDDGRLPGDVAPSDLLLLIEGA
jgi:uncharacterized protein YycO